MSSKRAWLVGICGLLAVATSAPGQDAPAPELAPDQRTELETLTRQLRDADRTAQTKREAATILLTRRYPQAEAVLAELLSAADARAARIVIAEAVAATGLARPSLAEPLLEMLQAPAPDLRNAAAGALKNYKDPAVIERLAELAGDGAREVDARLSAISALSGVLDRQAVDTLITLLESPDPAVRAAAAEGLARLTGIRGFGDDRRRWRSWWQANKDKDRQQWLEDLLESLSRQNASLQQETQRLESRLAESMTAVYEAAAEPDRPGLLMSYLNDPLAAVRTIGLELASQRLRRSEAPPAELVDRVRALLGDEDPRVRAASAGLIARLRPLEAPQWLLERLGVEQAPSARESLVVALGELRAVEAVGPLLETLAAEPNGVATAAATALGRIAGAHELDGARGDRAAAVLIDRFERTDPAQARLREALLGAMGALARPGMKPMIAEALTDPVATVRLAAVRAAAEVPDGALAAEVAALAGDSDRGIRLAVIAAMGEMAAPQYVQTVLARTAAELESDPTIRQRAWDVALALLAEAPPAEAIEWADRLADRPDAAQMRIRLLTGLLERLDEPEQRARVRIELAEALLAVGRASEAAEHLAAAYRGAAEAERPALWLRWLGAMLAANDPAAAAEIGVQDDRRLAEQGLVLLFERLAALAEAEQSQGLIALASATRERLGGRLSPDRQQAVAEALEQGRAAQRQADRQRVQRPIEQLTAADAATAEAIENELLSMRDRAVGPLVEQLQRIIETEAAAALEGCVVALLERLAPQLSGYDLDSETGVKRRLLQRWRRQLESPVSTVPTSG